jgi:hypothetical protein
VIAASFGFPAGEILDMTFDELAFWLREATWLKNRKG